jgi:hypothetical protein
LLLGQRHGEINIACYEKRRQPSLDAAIGTDLLD